MTAKHEVNAVLGAPFSVHANSSRPLVYQLSETEEGRPETGHLVRVTDSRSDAIEWALQNPDSKTRDEQLRHLGL